MADQKQIAIPPGQVVMTTHGAIRMETAQCLMEMRSFTEKQGLHNVTWQMVPGALPEKTRNEAGRQLLRTPGADWLLQIDADMTFAPDALIRLLTAAYAEAPHFDIIGAYCPLRGDMALPTIDTGTGTWESVFPGEGIREVIRTGAAFLLTKRRVLEGMKEPWWRMRVPARPLDFMAEVDGFARQKFDGKNPFRDLPNGEWERLYQCALEDPSASPEVFVHAEVGEDSSLCDRARFHGFRIAVHTDVATGHVDHVVRNWTDHKKAIAEMQRNQSYAVGLL